MNKIMIKKTRARKKAATLRAKTDIYIVEYVPEGYEDTLTLQGRGPRSPDRD
jgi:hypothetical protein